MEPKPLIVASKLSQAEIVANKKKLARWIYVSRPDQVRGLSSEVKVYVAYPTLAFSYTYVECINELKRRGIETEAVWT